MTPKNASVSPVEPSAATTTTTAAAIATIAPLANHTRWPGGSGGAGNSGVATWLDTTASQGSDAVTVRSRRQDSTTGIDTENRTGATTRVTVRLQSTLCNHSGWVLWDRIAHHGPGAEFRGAADRMVAHRGGRHGSHHAGDRGPGGVQLCF